MVLAVIKADAYGHGAVEVAKALESHCAFFGVSSILEALELRQANITTPILILGYTPVPAFPAAVSGEIRPAIFHEADAQALSQAAQKLGRIAKCHLAVDTGMSRIGFQVTEEMRTPASVLRSCPIWKSRAFSAILPRRTAPT